MTLNDLIARIEARFRLIRATPDVLQKDMIHQMAKASVMDTLDWVAQSRTTPGEADASTTAKKDAAQAA